MPAAGFSGVLGGAAAPAAAMAPSAGVQLGRIVYAGERPDGPCRPCRRRRPSPQPLPLWDCIGAGGFRKLLGFGGEPAAPYGEGLFAAGGERQRGAGKSAVALLAAHAAQGLGLRTLLLDFDLQFGDMAQLMGVKKPLRIDRCLPGPSTWPSFPARGRLLRCWPLRSTWMPPRRWWRRRRRFWMPCGALRRDRGEHGRRVGRAACGAVGAQLEGAVLGRSASHLGACGAARSRPVRSLRHSRQSVPVHAERLRQGGAIVVDGRVVRAEGGSRA